MDTGPREGDILLENNWKYGTPEWYKVEANNALYYQRHQQQCHPLSMQDMLFRSLMRMYYGRSFDSIF